MITCISNPLSSTGSLTAQDDIRSQDAGAEYFPVYNLPMISGVIVCGATVAVALSDSDVCVVYNTQPLSSSLKRESISRQSSIALGKFEAHDISGNILSNTSVIRNREWSFFNFCMTPFLGEKFSKDAVNPENFNESRSLLEAFKSFCRAFLKRRYIAFEARLYDAFAISGNSERSYLKFSQ